MKNLQNAIWAEWKKVIKSKVLYGTVILFIFIPLMISLIVYITRNPEMGEKMGMIGTKAKMFGENDWKGYLTLTLQMIAALGLIAYGFICSWIFGREYGDHTLKDLLALPVPRSTFVHAKMIIAALWGLLLAIILYSCSISMGSIMHLPGYSQELFAEFTSRYIISVLLTILLMSPIAWITGMSRGIIAPLAFVILSIIMAQFSGYLGIGPFFPWAIPGLFAVNSPDAGLVLKPTSFIILAATFILGYALTLRHWNRADHH